MKKNFKFVILVFLFVSCGFLPPKWVHLPHGGKQPVNSSYHLSKENYIFSSLIDTNSIYMLEIELVKVDRHGKIIREKRINYEFLCFNSDGICFVSNYILEYPVEIEVKQYIEFNVGQFCYYKITGNLIIIESYNYLTKIFEYWYGNILSNGNIHFFKRKGRPWATYTGKLNDIYQKTDLKRLSPLNFPN